ncbi:MAG TPA: hypothetical protein VFN61_03095 [Acidimicrobiales bacterium]|nr:hypothetical protein [Acidimicrobiales bacterium]
MKERQARHHGGPVDSSLAEDLDALIDARLAGRPAQEGTGESEQLARLAFTLRAEDLPALPGGGRVAVRAAVLAAGSAKKLYHRRLGMAAAVTLMLGAATGAMLTSAFDGRLNAGRYRDAAHLSAELAAAAKQLPNGAARQIINNVAQTLKAVPGEPSTTLPPGASRRAQSDALNRLRAEVAALEARNLQLQAALAAGPASAVTTTASEHSPTTAATTTTAGTSPVSFPDVAGRSQRTTTTQRPTTTRARPTTTTVVKQHVSVPPPVLVSVPTTTTSTSAPTTSLPVTTTSSVPTSTSSPTTTTRTTTTRTTTAPTSTSRPTTTAPPTTTTTSATSTTTTSTTAVTTTSTVPTTTAAASPVRTTAGPGLVPDTLPGT